MNEEDNNRTNDSNNERPGIQAACDHMMARKVDAFLWLTRLGTIIFTLLSIIPLFGVNPYSCYQRALMSNAATSALRLHQRLPHVQFTREFWVSLLIEDSCHYLFYSLIFIYPYPITLVLLPILLFAVLHSANYSIVILNKLGFYDTWATRMFMSLVHHQRDILRLVAFAEIILLPVTIFTIFSGKGRFLTAFVYYQFLIFRYGSRRNPYTRNVFHEIRLIIEGFANSPGRAEGLKRFCHKIISFTSQLAPNIPPQQ